MTRSIVDMPDFTYDDGGRAAAGFKGHAGDCVTRAIAIATATPYQAVYDGINATAQRSEKAWLKGDESRVKFTARTGVTRRTYEKYLRERGWQWTPTMGIGTGCRVHLCAEELPSGRLIVRLSKHLTAMIDGVIHDIYDPSRDGWRCVYGYFSQET